MTGETNEAAAPGCASCRCDLGDGAVCSGCAGDLKATCSFCNAKIADSLLGPRACGACYEKVEGDGEEARDDLNDFKSGIEDVRDDFYSAMGELDRAILDLGGANPVVGKQMEAALHHLRAGIHYFDKSYPPKNKAPKYEPEKKAAPKLTGKKGGRR